MVQTVQAKQSPHRIEAQAQNPSKNDLTRTKPALRTYRSQFAVDVFEPHEDHSVCLFLDAYHATSYDYRCYIFDY